MHRRMLLATQQGIMPPQDYILCYDFNGDFLDKSPNSLHGVKTGTASFGPGSKTGKQCLNFNGGCVRTPIALPLNSDKITISFGVKTIQQDTSIIAEMSSNYNSRNAFALLYQLAGPYYRIQMSSHLISYNGRNTQSKINTGEWIHIVAMSDRSLSADDQTTLNVNGRNDTLLASHNEDQNGKYIDNTMYIGQRNANEFPFVGSIQNFKIYNRILNRAEILGLRSEIF